MTASSNIRKVLLFGLLGALGCLAGWLVGEMFLLVSLPTSNQSGGSLASKPVLPPLPSREELPLSPPPPPLEGANLTFARVQPAPPPPVIPVNSSSRQMAAPPPAEFAQRLEKAGAKSGDVQITLIWSNFNDLDLHCIEPSGQEIYYARRKSRSGGELDVDMNASGAVTNQPVENIYWPKGKTPYGKYKVFVNHFANHGGKDPTDYKVNVLVGGQRQEFSGKISRNQPKRLITEIDVTPSSLEMKSDTPDLRIAVSPEMIINQGGQNHLKVRIARSNLTGRVNCRFVGDLAGISAPEFAFAADQTEATVEIAADESARLGVRTLTVMASAGKATAETRFQLAIKTRPPELRLAVSPVLVVNQGHSNRLMIRISRSGFKGPIQLRFGGDLRGIGPREVSAAEADAEIAADLHAEVQAPAGERTLTVRTSAGALEAETSFRLQVNETLPALRLAAPSEIALSQDGQNQLPLRLARDRFEGPITIRLEGDLDGVSPREFTIPAERDEYEVTFTTAKAAAGSRDIHMRATSGVVQLDRKLRINVVSPPVAGPQWSWRLVFVVGFWTVLLTLGLALALVMGQNWYLARPWISLREFVILAAGSLLAGGIAGGVGQALYGLLTIARLVPEIGFLAGWLLLGGLLGRGLVFFIPNLSSWRAVAGGSCGGLLGAITFIAISFVGDIAGRFMGAAILGLALGLMVAIVEATFRRIWLEVVDDSGEVRVVNLGSDPIVIGGDARWCSITVAGSPGKALKFWEDKTGQVFCLDILSEKTYSVSPGYSRTLRNAKVVVCSNEKAVESAPLAAAKSIIQTSTPADADAVKAKATPTVTTSAPRQPAQEPSPKQAPAILVKGPCPMCNELAKGIAGKRRCENCWTMF